MPLDCGERGEALPGEAFGQQRQIVGDRRAEGERVVGGVQELLDGLDAERVGVVATHPGGRGVHGLPLVDRQRRTRRQHAGHIPSLGTDRMGESADAPGQFIDHGVKRRRLRGGHRVGDRPVQPRQSGG